MEVAGVAHEHHAAETELFSPEAAGDGDGEKERGLLEEPDTVVPDPVALRPFLKQGHQET